jgi:DNA-binding CsgD family transcriptional regulator
MPRFVVLEGVDAATARAVADEGGLPVVTVADAPAAAQAVLAALRGADLVVLATAQREVIDQLCDDLRHLGELDHRVGASAGLAPVLSVLSADERALLAQLIGGASLGEAARVLHLSRRTADRRLAAARRALGAATTSEALVLARRSGVTSA